MAPGEARSAVLRSGALRVRGARRHAAHDARGYARGFAYLWLLFFVAAMGASLAAGGVVWEVRVRREKERDLLFIGAEFRRAIANYHRLTPQAAKELPRRLEDLLEDRRGPAPLRHLRRIYPDPLTGRTEWGQVVVQGRVTGVYSLARGVPLRQGDFSESDAFAGARRYADWRFIPADITAPPGPPDPPGSTPGAAPAPAPATAPAALSGPGSPQPAQPSQPNAAERQERTIQ